MVERTKPNLSMWFSYVEAYKREQPEWKRHEPSQKVNGHFPRPGRTFHDSILN